MWAFLYKQRKWRVWSLRMFYVLATLCVMIRIFISIANVCLSNRVDVFFVIVPVSLKFGVGLEQVIVVVEITLKVRENFN